MPAIARVPDGFGPSDHASFYGRRIPVLAFFTGAHDGYHRPTDDLGTIDPQGEVRVLDLDVDVTDSKGQPVPDLKREDFTVKIGGKTMPIDYFARVNNDLVTNAGDILENLATLSYRHGETGATVTAIAAAPTVTVVEPRITLSKTVANVTPGKLPADQPVAGDTLEYRIIAANTGTATAFDNNFVDTLPPGGSSMNGMNLSGKPGIVQRMQIPPTLGQPPIPLIQPRLVTLQLTTGPQQPSLTRHSGVPYSIVNWPCS